MILIRLCKVFMVAALGAFAAIVAYDNIVDYGSNYAFVQHVLSMDTTFAGNRLRDRAITSETAWEVAYAAIIAAEAITAGLLLGGAALLLARLRAPAAVFDRAKWLAVLGVTVGFAVWFLGFMVIGGEYFAMWQSPTWNGQEAAFRFYITLLGVGIFLNQSDAELAG